MYNKLNRSIRILHHFWKRVIIPLDLNDCWIWNGWTDRDGYGKFGFIDDNGIRQMYNTHRFSYECYNGQIPEELLVCHDCDNPPCINPNHLFCGTQNDNIQDKVQKGRSIVNVGEDNPMCYHTSNEIQNILDDIVSGKYTSVNMICNDFDINNQTVHEILRGEAWNHIGKNYNLKELQQKILYNEQNRKLAKQIKIDLKSGLSVTFVAAKHQKHYNVVYRIKKGITYSDIII